MGPSSKMLTPGWIEIPAPSNRDLYIPSELRDKVRVFYKTHTATGTSIDWVFENLDNCSCHKDCVTIGDRQQLLSTGKQCKSATYTSETIHHKEPPYITEADRVRTLPMELPRRSSVYCNPIKNNTIKPKNDKVSSDSFRVGNVIIRANKNFTAHAEPINPQMWLQEPAHQYAFHLGESEPNLKGCYIAYSSSEPKTHILIGSQCIHITPALGIEFFYSPQ